MVGIAAVAVFTGTVVTATGPHAGDKQAARLHFPIADVARAHSMVVMLLLAAVLGVAWLSRQPGRPPVCKTRSVGCWSSS